MNETLETPKQQTVATPSIEELKKIVGYDEEELARLDALSRTMSENAFAQLLAEKRQANEQAELPHDERIIQAEDAGQRVIAANNEMVPTSAPAGSAPSVVPTSSALVPASPGALAVPDDHLQPHEEPLTLTILGRDKDADRAARQQADERLNRELNEGSKLRRLVQRVWKGGIANETYRQAYIRQAKKEIEAEQDVLKYAGGDEARHKAATESILERFRAGKLYVDESVKEVHNELDADSDMSIDIRNLILAASRQGAATEWTREKIQETYQKILLRDQQREHTELSGGQKVTTTDLMDVIESLRGRGMHDDALLHAVTNMRVITGETRSGSRTEANYTTADKIIEKLGKNELVGKLVPEAALSISVSAAFMAVNLGRGTLARVVGVGTPGVLGAVVGGAKARKRAKNDIAMRRSQRELGKIFGERDKFDDMLYPDKLVPELVAELRKTVADEVLDQGGEEALKEALKKLAEAKVRRELTNAKDPKERKPLLRYTDDLLLEAEKKDLRDAEIEAFTKLSSRLEGFDAEGRQRLGLAEGTGLAQPLRSLEAPLREAYLGEIEKADKEARKFIVGQAAVGAAMGFVISGASSLALQEATHLVAEQFGSNPTAPNLTPPTQYVDQGNHMSINGGNSIVQDPATHTFTVKGPDGHDLATGLSTNPDGTFTPDSLAKLNSAHLTAQTVPHSAGYGSKVVPMDQYVNNHPAEFNHYQTSWEDNGTPGTADYNELGGRLSYNQDGTVNIGQYMSGGGSANAEGAIDMTHGPNVFDMAFRQPDGSYVHKTFPYGQPVGKPWADMLYQKPDGTWGFKGNGYVSWGQVHGNTFDAAASLPGDGTATGIPDQVVQSPAYVETRITASPLGGGGSSANGLPLAVVATAGREGIAERRGPDAPPVSAPGPDTPELSRSEPPRALEAAPPKALDAAPDSNPTPVAAEAGAAESFRGEGLPDAQERLAIDPVQNVAENGGNSSLRENFTRDRMSELRRNPKAQVELGQAVDAYYSRIRNKDPQFVKNIETILEKNISMEKLAIDTDVIMPFTINAVDDADIVYDSLKRYGELSRAGNSKSRILLNVTFLDTDEAEEADRIRQTRSAIAQVIAEYPELRISQFETVLEDARLENGEYGGRTQDEIADETLYATILLAAEKAIRTGVEPNKRAPDKDILILRRPFDSGQLNGQEQLEQRMLEAMERNPEKDVFNGGVRWGLHDTYKDMPSVGFVTSFMEIAKIRSRRERTPLFKPLLAVNMGLRLSTIAAVGGGGHYSEARTNQTKRTYDLAIGERVAAARKPARAAKAVSDSRDASNDFGMYVTKAVINADASLFEQSVLRGNQITNAVFEMRRGAVQAGPRTGSDASRVENVEKQPNMIISRTESGITNVIKKFGLSEAQYRGALAFMVPMKLEKNSEGKVTKRTPMYTIRARENGDRVFKFTKDGERWLLEQFRRNPLYN